MDDSNDYTSFIMKVINKAVGIANENKLDSRERTVFEIFSEFNEKMFWLSKQKNYQKMEELVVCVLEAPSSPAPSLEDGAATGAAKAVGTVTGWNYLKICLLKKDVLPFYHLNFTLLH